MDVLSVGSICFGLVIGWVTYRTLRRQTSGAAISDIAAVVSAVGGGSVTLLTDETLFAWYAIGLAIGFFGYFAIGIFLDEKKISPGWMINDS